MSVSKKSVQRFCLILSGLIVLSIGVGKMGFLAGKKPGSVKPRALVEVLCPVNSQNCIATTDPNNSYFQIMPLPFIQNDVNGSKKVIKQILETQYRSRATQENESYLHFEVRTPLLGFVDDVEFFFSVDEKVIHMRSASRLGLKDLGANKKRLLNIEQQYKFLANF
jgi:uncharacterized protein (DUF1499 family)